MASRKIITIAASAFALALAGVGFFVWVSGGREAARQAEAEPAVCRDPAVVAKAAAASAHPGMRYVPGGTFEMGDTVYAEEAPMRVVSVDGFWIDETEVTNDEFAAFVAATGYVTVAEKPVDPAQHAGLTPDLLAPGAVVFVMPNNVDGSGNVTQWWQYVAGADWRHPAGPATSIKGYGAYPVVNLAYADIKAYAAWKGTSIPSEVQWEWAARGGAAGRPEHEQPKAANTWQGIFPVLNAADDGFAGLAPVGCYEPNGYGLYDMIGNVWEWTADPYQGNQAQRAIKGGSFLCAPNYCMRYRAAARQGQDIDLATSHLGFRTVLNAPAPEVEK